MLLWDLKNTSKLRQYLVHITDVNLHELASHFLERFDQHVRSLIPQLRAQIIHNDLTPDNILVAADDPGQIVGLIDFDDMVHTPLIHDLATTIASMLGSLDQRLYPGAELSLRKPGWRYFTEVVS